jgi:hypothetical protein
VGDGLFHFARVVAFHLLCGALQVLRVNARHALPRYSIANFGHGLTDQTAAQEASTHITQILVLAFAYINSFLFGRVVVVPAPGSIHVPSEVLWVMMEHGLEK